MNKWNLYSSFCALIGILAFLYGFFWTSYDGRRTSTDDRANTWNGEHPPRIIQAPIQKVVLVVVDALRYDFVVENNTSENMPFLHSSIVNKEACVFPCRVHLPTVTMPRIKAMTVGRVSNFVDIALNFGSTRVYDDNLLAQMVQNGRKIVFYGDDTWIRLFPGLFLRQEGTTSFFVSDFYEVDNNVTRNIDKELARNDWDVMILHYLGLDHIGHLEGPTSSKVPLKLQEMDAIVQKLDSYLLEWKKRTNCSYLLIVCADHGMKDSGGHGGSTLAEVVVPFVTFGVPCSADREISQVDMAVTISTLMGLPIPRENVGKMITGLLLAFPTPVKVEAYRTNTEQLMKSYIDIIGDVRPDIQNLFEKAEKLRTDDPEEACRAYELLLSRLSWKLIDSLTKFDVFCLCTAILLLLQAFALPLTACSLKPCSLVPAFLLSIVIFILMYIPCYFLECSSLLISFSGTTAFVSYSLTFLISFNLTLLRGSGSTIIDCVRTSLLILKRDAILTFMVLGSLLQIVSFVSTSFIEEEHLTWYFLWTSLLTLVFIQHCNKRTFPYLVLLLILQRVLRKLNQTGDQWASLPDISDWLLAPQRQYHLSVFLILELLGTFLALRYVDKTPDDDQAKRSRLVVIISLDKYSDALCLIAIYLYRAAVGEVVFFNKYLLSNRGISEFHVYSCLLATSTLIKLARVGYHWRRMPGLRLVNACISAWTLLIAVLMRPHNLILLGSLVVTTGQLSRFLKLESNAVTKIVIAHHWLAHIYFFYQGNSNSLASIDVAPGYVGQTEYNAVLAGTFIVICTYAMPVLAYLLMLQEVIYVLYESQESWIVKRFAAQASVNVLLTLTNFSVGFYLFIVTVQRHHLFIWSVFSPKLLYLSAYSLLSYSAVLAVQLCVNIPER